MTTEYNILNEEKNNNNNKLNTGNNIIHMFFTVDPNGFASEPLVRMMYRRVIFENVKTPVNTWRRCVCEKKNDLTRFVIPFPRVAFSFSSKINNHNRSGRCAWHYPGELLRVRCAGT